MASNSDQDKSSKLAASWVHDQTYDTTWNNLMYRADIIWYAESSQSKFVYLCTIHIIHNLPCWDPLGQRPSDGAWRMHLLYLALAFHLFFSYIILYYIISSVTIQWPHSNHTADQQIRLPLLMWIHWNPGDQHSFRFRLQVQRASPQLRFRGWQIFAPWSSETQNLSNSVQDWYRASSTSKLQYQHIPYKIMQAASFLL
jgi:hypothetical protein